MKMKKRLSFLLIFFQIFTFINFSYFVSESKVKAEENTLEQTTEENNFLPIDNEKALENDGVELYQEEITPYATESGWISYDEVNKRLQIKIEGMIPTVPNTEYEYDIFGFVVRYAGNDGKKYLTQIAANTTSESSGFVLVPGSYKKFIQNGVTYETATNSLSLYNLQSIFEKDFPGVSFSNITDPTQNSIFFFDAIYSVKSPGQTSYRGGVNIDRLSYGEYYMTLNGTHSYNGADYVKSSKYVAISSYDSKKGGVIGSKLYDTGVAWLSNAINDIRNNYNKSITIFGSKKPDVSKTVTIKYLDKDTNLAVAPEESYTYMVGSEALSKTYSAKTVPYYTYSYYKIDKGTGLGPSNTGSNASCVIATVNSKHEVIFYYKKSSDEKVINIKGVDTSNNAVLFETQDVRTVTNDTDYTYIAKTLDSYTYNGYKRNVGGVWSSMLSGNGSLTLKPDGSIYELVFYYTPKKQESTSPSGQISFSPFNSGWKNSNIDVTITVTGDKEITKYGTQRRSYTYRTRDWHSGYYTTEKDKDGKEYEKWHPGYWGSYYNVTESTNCSFEQVWEIDKVSVYVNSAKDINNREVSVSLSTYSLNSGGSTTIQTEANNILLGAKISGWKEKSKSWSNVSPPAGSWNSTSLTASTTKPTETYTSNSGTFKLDKTAPKITPSIVPDNKWTNKDITVGALVDENLSDLSTNSYALITDSSHIKNADIKILKKSLGIINSSYKHNFSYTLKNDGIYSIKYNMEDNATNLTTLTQSSFKLDKTKPNPATFSNDDRVYIDSDLVVSIGVSDNLSGIEKVEMAVTDSETYNNETKKNLNLTTLENVKDNKATYKHTINSNGTYYFHVWSYDRAGNETYTVSKGYKYFKINEKDILINPYANPNKVMRGTRFDIVATIEKFTKEDFDNSQITYKMPNWINDDINKKVNGQYYATLGFGTDTIAKEYSKDDKLQLWNSYTAPFGSTLTYNKDGQKVGNDYKVEVVLEYKNYVFGAKKSRIVISNFGVIPEQVIKTQIIYNE